MLYEVITRQSIRTGREVDDQVIELTPVGAAEQVSERGLPHVEIEIRQDLIMDEA